MKSVGGKTFCFCLLIVLFQAAGFFVLPNIVLASEDDLIITEIMYDPGGVDSGHSDWVEIYNPTEEKIIINKDKFGITDEEHLELGSDGVHYKNCHKIDGDLEIKPGKFAIIASNKNDFKSDYLKFDGDVLDSAFSLSSAGDSLRLSNDKCENFFIDFDFENSWGGKNNGKTLEKIKLNESNKKSNWQESYTEGGTPGEENSKKPEPKEYSGKIRINEILPNPSGDELKDEYIEVYNYSNGDIDLESWELRDAGTGEYVFPKNTVIKKDNFLVVYRKDFKFAINNSEEVISLLNPNGVETSIVLCGNKPFKSDISYSFDGIGWQRSSYLTPEKENKLDKAPNIKIKKDDKIYKNIYANFEVKTGDKNQKVVWDFGDGHKSYLQETKHKYSNTGIFKVLLVVKGKSDDFTENFTVEVEKFGESKIKIVSVKANPKGKDDKESITIQNNSKKKINLKNWSIATGWDNLYNHPISKDLIIKPGKSKEITKKYSAFALNNKQTKIELRYPDGTVASKVKYSKKEGVEDDEVYEKGESGWEWIGVQTNIDSTQTSAEELQNDATKEREKSEESLADENKSKDQVENNVEIQADEPAENQDQGEVLGVEIVRNDKSENKKGIFQTIFWNINQFVNNLINFFL
ncbi:MAG: lamin tail domain-containing protein [Parcubacteria group bacterium]|jgi:hypothetical protein